LLPNSPLDVARISTRTVVTQRFNHATGLLILFLDRLIRVRSVGKLLAQACSNGGLCAVVYSS
jgi:hypothetical protein